MIKKYEECESSAVSCLLFTFSISNRQLISVDIKVLSKVVVDEPGQYTLQHRICHKIIMQSPSGKDRERVESGQRIHHQLNSVIPSVASLKWKRTGVVFEGTGFQRVLFASFCLSIFPLNSYHLSNQFV